MDSYEDPFSKIALTLTATQMAKNMIVRSEGIGEDLSFNFFTWRNDTPVMCVQLESKYMKESHEKRFFRCKELINILRFRLNITAITFICEGYVASAPQKEELSLAFIKSESDVKECLTVVHCEESLISSPDIYLFSMPYSYKLGKHVTWGHLMEFSQNAAETMKKYWYPSMLRDAFVRKIDREDTNDEIDELILDKIVACGFLIQQF